MIRIRSIPVFIVLIGLLLGCAPRGERVEAPISREQFIEANVALRKIDPEAEDAQEQRQQVLREQQVTEEELRRFVDVHATDTEALARIWEEIHRRLVAEDETADPAETEEGRTLDPAPQ